MSEIECPCVYIYMQSITVRKYPAELSLACLICFVGSLQSGAVALITDHHKGAWSLGWDYRLFSPLYAVSTFFLPTSYFIFPSPLI